MARAAKKAAKASKTPAKTGVVSAAGTATRSAASQRGAAIQTAMEDAIKAAAAAGISDPVEVKKRMDTARKSVTG